MLHLIAQTADTKALIEGLEKVMSKTAETRPTDTLLALVVVGLVVAFLIFIYVLYRLEERSREARRKAEESRITAYQEHLTKTVEACNTSSVHGRAECHAFTVQMMDRANQNTQQLKEITQEASANVSDLKEIVRDVGEIVRDAKHT